MKAFCRVMEVCPVISGTSDNGNDWEKQTVVFETLALEPQTLAIEFMGERRTKQTKTLKAGQQVEVTFGINCREYLGKWYTRLDGFGVTPMKPEEAPKPAEGEQAQMEMPAAPAEDLPY